jgi:tetratricopeptide (TPR) repeat protein
VTGEERSGKISWLWSQVEDARRNRDPEQAREGLERLLASQEIRGAPDHDLALLYLSQLEMEEGLVAEAARRLQGFQWHGIPGPAALLLAADLFMRLDWYDNSMEALESYLQHYPQDTDALRKKGLLLLMRNRDAEAERTLNSVARREKFRIPSTLSYLAMLEAKRGNLEESLHLLLQARGLAPFDERIEHTLLRIEALRVRLRRSVIEREEIPLESAVPGMAAGMLGLHGYSRDKARKAAAVWNHFCALEKPSGRKPEIWAAALEYAVTRNGPHFTQEQLAEEYGVSSTRMGEHYRLLAATVDLDAPEDPLDEAAREGETLSLETRREEMADVLAGLAGRLASFSEPGDAVEWVHRQLPALDEPQRREVEDFVAYIWRKRRNTAL